MPSARQNRTCYELKESLIKVHETQCSRIECGCEVYGASKTMKQVTFGTVTGFEKHQKVTRRAQFLSEMNQVVPWLRLMALIEPYYPKAGNGRPPKGLEIMLRM